MRKGPSTVHIAYVTVAGGSLHVRRNNVFTNSRPKARFVASSKSKVGGRPTPTLPNRFHTENAAPVVVMTASSRIHWSHLRFKTKCKTAIEANRPTATT